MRPKHPRPDATQRAIIAELRALDFCVWNLSTLGGEVLDIMVGGWDAYRREDRWVAFEIKATKGRLTNAQLLFFTLFPHLPAEVVYSTEDILRVFGRLDE